MLRAASAYLQGNVSLPEHEPLCVVSWLLSLVYFSAQLTDSCSCSWDQTFIQVDFSYVFPEFSSSQFFRLYSGAGRWGKRRLAIQSLNAGRQTALCYSTFFAGEWWILLGQPKQWENNLDSFRGSVVCIPPLSLSVLVTQSYLPFSRKRLLKALSSMFNMLFCF